MISQATAVLCRSSPARQRVLHGIVGASRVARQRACVTAQRRDSGQLTRRLDVKKRFSEEQIIGFRREAGAGVAIKELCRKHGFSDALGGWRIDPGLAEAFHDRGLAWSAKRDYDRAIADYDATIQIRPQSAPTFFSRGLAKEAKEDFDGAVADFTRATDADPMLVKAYGRLSWVLATAKSPSIRDGPRAVGWALKTCSLSGYKNVDCARVLAAAFARNGEYDKDVYWQEKAMEDPHLSTDEVEQKRLRLYGERKAWPPD
jgi:tetratricopeptide (TPR) repeat protein